MLSEREGGREGRIERERERKTDNSEIYMYMSTKRSVQELEGEIQLTMNVPNPVLTSGGYPARHVGWWDKETYTCTV